MTHWTEDMIAALTAAWERGESGGQIGKSMGLTRNAVIGKANRLGLSSRKSPIGEKMKWK